MELFSLLGIIELDQYLFHIINGEWTNSLFDNVLPIWRNKFFWVPVYIFIIIFSLSNYGYKGYWFIVCLMACVGTADFVSNTVVKKNVERIRPCNDYSLSQVRELVRCGSGYSFTSNHAANHFAMSFFLLLTIGRRFKKLNGFLIFWAVSVAYAQVYVGVHFPLDVISGAILGILIAFFFRWMYTQSNRALIFNDQ